MKTKSNWLIVLLVVSFVFLLTASIQLKADDTVICPVSGKEIKKSEAKGTYEYKGKTYYFCCENCKDTFVKDPDKILSQKPGESHSQAEQQEHNTVVDPVCGMKIKKSDATATYEYQGKTYYFCMTGCKDKFVKNPGEYIKSSEEMVACVVTGEKVKKSDAKIREYQGKNYYFCCPGCVEKFDQDPEKYIK